MRHHHLSSLTDSLPGGLREWSDTLMRAGGGGNLTAADVGANLHMALGLDLSQPASMSAGSLPPINATGGALRVQPPGPVTRPRPSPGTSLQATFPALRLLQGLGSATVSGGPGAYKVTGGARRRSSAPTARRSRAATELLPSRPARATTTRTST